MFPVYHIQYIVPFLCGDFCLANDIMKVPVFTCDLSALICGFLFLFFAIVGDEVMALADARVLLPEWIKRFPTSAFFTFLNGRLAQLTGNFPEVGQILAVLSLAQFQSHERERGVLNFIYTLRRR